MGKKVLILGGGLLQVPLILKAKEKGCRVFLSDYYENPPGRQYCDVFRRISTIDLEANYQFASEENIDFIMTIGTDQPVLTAAHVSSRLGLPFPITEEQGRMVTNKKYMKRVMAEKGIPTTRFKVFSSLEEMAPKDLSFPMVLKPVDSQGQRGIFVLKGSEEGAQLKDWFLEAQKYSPTGTVILEEFYGGEEITVNTWVKGGQAFNLLITDRLHFDNTVALGLCKQQRYPSKSAAPYLREINRITQALVGAFKIKDGPLYIQMIVGDEGAKVVEFGYRIGGGFESETIPLAVGIDILELYYTLITTGDNLLEPTDIKEEYKQGSIFFLFAKRGRAEKIILPDEFHQRGKLFITEKKELGDITDATSRIGCFTIYSSEENHYKDLLQKFDTEMAVQNEAGVDLLIHNIWE